MASRQDPSDLADWDLARASLWRTTRMHFNDGLISAAGILQGLTVAGATGREALIAGLATTVVGGLLFAGGEYNEAAGELAGQRAVVEAERRRLALTPEDEFEELVDPSTVHKGHPSPGLARQVATELSTQGCVGRPSWTPNTGFRASTAPPISPSRPWGSSSVLAFMVGSLLPLLLLVISERAAREIGGVRPGRGVARGVERHSRRSVGSRESR